MFRESCSSLHQGEEQPDTDLAFTTSRNVGISRMDLDTEETRETHNFDIKLAIKVIN